MFLYLYFLLNHLFSHSSPLVLYKGLKTICFLSFFFEIYFGSAGSSLQCVVSLLQHTGFL